MVQDAEDIFQELVLLLPDPIKQVELFEIHQKFVFSLASLASCESLTSLQVLDSAWLQRAFEATAKHASACACTCASRACVRSAGPIGDSKGTLRFALCALHFALCALRFALCALHFARCALRVALCALRFARCANRSLTRTRYKSKARGLVEVRPSLQTISLSFLARNQDLELRHLRLHPHSQLRRRNHRNRKSKKSKRQKNIFLVCRSRPSLTRSRPRQRSRRQRQRTLRRPRRRRTRTSSSVAVRLSRFASLN
jgi:hypothetical protein